MIYEAHVKATLMPFCHKVAARQCSPQLGMISATWASNEIHCWVVPWDLLLVHKTMAVITQGELQALCKFYVMLLLVSQLSCADTL